MGFIVSIKVGFKIYYSMSTSKIHLEVSVVTKAVYPETEALGFEAEAPVFETEAEAVDPDTEAARQCVNKSYIWAVSLKRKEYKHFLT